jgi:hypothetical protein
MGIYGVYYKQPKKKNWEYTGITASNYETAKKELTKKKRRIKKLGVNISKYKWKIS